MVKTYCPSTGVHNHETFECLEDLGHDENHKASYVNDACPNCDSWEEHSSNCPTSDVMANESFPLQEIQWTEDDGKAFLVPYRDNNQ